MKAEALACNLSARVRAGTVTGTLARALIRLLNAFDRGTFPKPIDALATMPSQEPDRSAEAVRRVLPELRKLDRTSAAVLCCETERFSILLIEQNAETIL